MNTDGVGEAPVLTAVQAHTFDELLAVGADRPASTPGIVDELRDTLAAGVSEAVAAWTEPSLWVGKSLITSMSRCEAQVVAERQQPNRQQPTMHPATAVGVVTHRALQLAHTHLGHPVAWYVEEAVAASLSEPAFAAMWADTQPGAQSDMQMQMLSRVCGFLDSWPPLDDNWSWRFEETVQARVAKITLSAKPDLILGRPRADGRQTMLLADFKAGGLQDHHETEASFYALVATLRFKVPPFRSCTYSLASGEWTDPDVTTARLRDTADTVVAAVNRYVEVMAGHREPDPTPGVWCRWCPLSATCAEGPGCRDAAA